MFLQVMWRNKDSCSIGTPVTDRDADAAINIPFKSAGTECLYVFLKMAYFFQCQIQPFDVQFA